jgi:hypothetical protein
MSIAETSHSKGFHSIQLVFHLQIGNNIRWQFLFIVLLNSDTRFELQQ